MGTATVIVTNDVIKHLGVLDANEDWRKALLLTEKYVVDSVTMLEDGHANIIVTSSEIPDGYKFMKMVYKMVNKKIHLADVHYYRGNKNGK